MPTSKPGGEEKSAIRSSVRLAALLVALFTIVVGVVGLISPEGGTSIRRLYFATPVGQHVACAIRVVMGLVVILCAPASRTPKILRVLGAMMCIQGIAGTLMGPYHARAVLEWETAQGAAVLRIGAAVALACGVFIAFAVLSHRRSAN